MAHLPRVEGPCCICGENYYLAHRGKPYCSVHFSRVTVKGEPGPPGRIHKSAAQCVRCGGKFRRYFAGEPLCQSCSDKARYWADPEEARRKNAAYYEQNRLRLLELGVIRSRVWHADPRNRMKIRAWHAAWRAANRDRKRAQERGRHERLTKSIPEAALDMLYQDVCCYCGGSDDVTVDHIVPLADGGAHDWANLTAACHSCNSKKRAKSLLSFLLTFPRVINFEAANGPARWTSSPPRKRCPENP